MVVPSFSVISLQSTIDYRGLSARLRLRRRTVGDFGSMAVAVAGTGSGGPANTVWRDTLFQFFDVESQILHRVHLLSLYWASPHSVPGKDAGKSLQYLKLEMENHLLRVTSSS
jgi:hypothetical protein